MATVKCKICGKQVDKSIAYKVESVSKSGKKTNKYFCSEEEYQFEEKEKEYFRKIYG